MSVLRTNVIAILCVLLAGAAIAEEGVSIEERILATIPDDITATDIVLGGDYFAFAPNGRNVAYTAKLGNKWLVMVGERRGDEYDSVGRPVLSPNGKIAAFTASIGLKRFVVIGTKKGKEYDDVQYPCFSADGSTVAYVANKGGRIDQFGSVEGGQYFVVSNDIEGPPWDNTFCPALSPDGETVAYLASRGKDRVVVIGGQASEAFDQVYPPVFSPDGTAVAYAYRKDASWFMVVGGKRSAAYDLISLPYRFSPDGARIVFAAQLGSKRLVVAGEEKILEVATDGDLESPIVSNDGQHVACELLERDKDSMIMSRLLLDGNKGEPFADIGPAVFNPKGTMVAYSAYSGSKKFVVIGNRKLEFESIAMSPVFTLDGKKLAFGARIDRELWWKVLDVE